MIYYSCWAVQAISYLYNQGDKEIIMLCIFNKVKQCTKSFCHLTLINARGGAQSSFVGESRFLRNQTSYGQETSP